MKAHAAVVALDRHHVGHAVAREDVARSALKIDSLDAGKVGAERAIDRPVDDACRLIELVKQCGTGNVDIDAVGIQHLAAGQLLGVDREDRVVAARPSLKERRRPHIDQVGCGRIRYARCGVTQ